MNRSPRIAPVLLLAALLACGTAAAADPVERGAKALQNGRFAEAKRLLAPAVADPKTPAGERRSARAFLAAALFHLKDEAGARRELSVLFGEDRSIALDDSVFSPKFVAFADSLRPSPPPPVKPEVKLEPVAKEEPPEPVASKPSGPIKLASFELSFVNVPPQEGNFYLESLNQELLGHGLRVTGSKDVQTLVGLERQKELLGCSDEEVSSCLKELGDALGVEAVLTGSLAKLGDGYVLKLKVMSSTRVEALALFSGRAENDEALLELTSTAARELAGKLRIALRPGSAPIEVSSSAHEGSTLREKAWIPAAVGGALLVGAGVGYVVTSGKIRSAEAQPTLPQFQVAKAEVEPLRTVTYALGGAGLAALGVAAGFFAFGGPDSPAPTVAVSPEGGVHFVLSGRLP